MASVFQNAVKFLGQTLKQAATIEFLKDYRHANYLFTGGNFRLSPKAGFLYHVFFDINTNLSSAIISDRISLSEIGLLVKSTDLPKFSIDIKKYNSYNRPNLVSNKITYETINMSFHDDSSNIIRNFWYDYYKYYYRDADYSETTYRLYHLYNQQNYGNYGFSRRKDSDENFLRAVRIYSLHQGRFSEYTLINPVIKTFRHGAHNSSDMTAEMVSEMSFDYENVLYADGKVGAEQPNGFAKLHYDTARSPLYKMGGVKSIFGAGGLMDTAGSVIGDIGNGNFISAALSTARAINTFKGVNLKKAAVNEVRGILTTTATQAITGAITQNMRSTPPGGYNVVVANTMDGSVSNKYNGIGSLSSTVALAGAAVLLNSQPVTNKYRSNPTMQSTTPKPSNYNPQFPLVPNGAIKQQAPGTLSIINDRAAQTQNTNQFKIQTEKRKLDLDQNIARLDQGLSNLNDQIALTLKEIKNNDESIATLTVKYNDVESLAVSDNEKQQLLSRIRAQITETENLKLANQTRLTNLREQVATNQTKLDNFTKERAALF